MDDFWSTSGLDLLVETRGTRRRASLEEALRHAIHSGRLPNGTRLPSSRALATDLGWSRGTVTAAYDQLVAEGYLATRRGSGTQVDFAAPATAAPEEQPAARREWRLDLRPGPPPADTFPVDVWLRHLRDALRDAPASSFGYGDPAGSLDLRTELAAYLGRVRGVRTTAANIVVTAGATQALSLLAGVLVRTRPDRALAIEDPGFWHHRHVLARSPLDVVALPVDAQGADPSGLFEQDVGAAVITPAHQYPTGWVMSPARRRRFIEWARRDGAFVIEDDYDGELRYDRRPVAALQGIASDVVVYVGTASKTLGPALRLGWMAVPDALLEEVVAAQLLTLQSIDVTSQLGFARLVARHAYDTRVRTVRNTFRRRHGTLAALVARLADEMPGLRLGGVPAGGQSPLLLPHETPGERAVMELAASRGLGLEGLARSSHVAGTHPPGLLVGFSRPSEHLYAQNLEALEGVLRDTHVSRGRAVSID